MGAAIGALASCLLAGPLAAASASIAAPCSCLLAAPPAASGATPAPCEVTLAEALDAAVAAQPSLAQAAAKARQARATAANSRGSLLPQLTGTAGARRQTSNFVLQPGQFPSGQKFDKTEPTDRSYSYFQTGLQLSQLVFDFGNAWGGYRAAAATADAADASARTALLDVRAAVRAAFYAARAKQALVAVQARARDNQRRHRDQVEQFVAVGRRPEIDRLQAQQDLAAAELAAIRAAGDAAAALATLRQAIGREGGPVCLPAAVAATPVRDEDLAADTLWPRALAALPESQVLAHQRRSAQAALAAGFAGLWPTLTGTAALTDVGPSPRDLTWNWNVGISLAWPLFAGGGQFATYDAARHGLASVDASQAAQRLQVRMAVEQALIGVHTARAATAAAADAAANAEQLLTLAEARYTAGVGSSIERGDAQVAATKAATDVVTAELDLATARAQLLRQLGEPD